VRRRRGAVYARHSLGFGWRAEAFIPFEKGVRLKPEYRASVVFVEQDVRLTAPEDLFDLVLCRYVAFTYFGDDLQQGVLERIQAKLRPGGALLIGASESLPLNALDWEPWSQRLRVYRRTGGPSRRPASPEAQCSTASSSPAHGRRSSMAATSFGTCDSNAATSPADTASRRTP